jgi:flavin reductase (DIM6/NTAB) family NADH-FMN oxidoreductase RutF
MSSIHSEDPFRPNDSEREPARRFRGRLASPVTIWTSGDEDQRAGLTVGSVMLAEGEPSHIVGLINDLTDLFDRIEATQGFVVHALERDQRVLAERFAGLWPSPGGLFADLDVGSSGWGPVLSDVTNRAYCRLVDVTDAGYQRMVRGRIERLDVEEIDDPLVHFRGRYRSLGP